MITNSIKELQTYRRRVAELESKLARELKAELAALPGKYGFDSIDAFIEAIRNSGKARAAAARKQGRPAAQPAAKSASPAPAAKGKRRRRRAKITPEIKAQVKAGVLAKKTSLQIAKEAGISLPSVQNIKKELGLVKARKK